MSIPLPPLSLCNYFFREISIKPREDYEGNNGDMFDFSGVLVTCNVSGGKNETVSGKNAEEHFVILEIEVADGEERQAPYSITCTAIGIFKPHPDLDKEKVEEVMAIQGATTLYASAREMLMTSTSRMGYGPFILPTMSFHGLKKD
ncbi:protein-export chaperone SecB [Alcanivorax sp. NBRC 102024]|uniref:protein-export chaperone SecB n=1 Tax=Alcanivorax sp. NBRC 102024 TaxID=1113895 RepID=UPI0018D3E5E1|nr:protein-export chaperone SecB [Alcanivorax sp. NBRC 102024]